MSEKKLTNQVTLYTVLLCLFGALMVGMGFVIFLGARNMVVYILFAIGFLATPTILKLLMEVYNKRRLFIVSSIKSDPDSILEQLTIEENEWSSYILTLKEKIASDLLIIPIGVAVITSGVSLWFLKKEYDWSTSLLYLLPIAIIAFILVRIYYGLYSKAKFKLINSGKKGQVIFTKDNILLNDHLIELSGMQQSVSTTELVKGEVLDTMVVTVSSRVGHRVTEKTHEVPVSKDDEQKAKKILTLYLK